MHAWKILNKGKLNCNNISIVNLDAMYIYKIIIIIK